MPYSVEDDRIIRAAVKARKISADSVRVWQHAIVADRAGTRRTLAELPAGWLGEDPEREARIVAAAALDLDRVNVKGGGTNPPPAAPVGPTDKFGFPVAGIPAPVVLKKGVPPEQWTERQRQDAMLRRLGPRFHPGTEAPPKGDQLYFPSPNDVSRYDEASGQWVEKNPYREI
jgi:hypothetical protein